MNLRKSEFKVVSIYAFLAIMVLLLFCFANRTAAQQAPEWVTIDPSKPPGTQAEVVLNTSASSSSQTLLDIFIYGFWVTEKLGPDTQTYHVVEIPGIGSYSQVGAPDLPALRFNLAVPTDASEAVLTVEPVDIRSFQDLLIWPQPIPEGETEPEEFVRDPEIYDYYQGFWPPADGITPTPISPMLRSIPGAKCGVWPCKWDPATGELQVAAHIQCLYQHIGSSQQFERITKERHRAAAARFLNWEVVSPLFPFNPIFYDAEFLIIYPDTNYADELAPFVTQKWARGFLVTEMTTSTTGTTCASIRAAINAWEAAVPVWRDCYCLLVGDTDVIPLCTSPTDDPTDDLYASTDGDDKDEEIYLGRLSVDNETDAANQIDKILEYEDHPSLFCCYDKVALWAHKQGAPGKYEGAHESVRTAVYAVTPTFHTYYGSQVGVTDADVSSRINNGVGVVAYRGHGSSNATATDWNQTNQYYNATDVTGLTNPMERSPVVWSFACTNTSLSSSDCIAENWMEQVGHGAVSYYGATVGSGTSQNHELDRQMFLAVYDLGFITESHAIEYAEAQMDVLVPDPFWENSWIYLLLGDPDLQIRRYNPLEFVVIVPLEVTTCLSPPCFLEVEVLDPDGMPIPEALVGLWKPGDGEGMSGNNALNGTHEVFDNRYTDASGMASVPASPTTPGWMYYAVEDGKGNAILDSILVVHSTDVAVDLTGTTDLHQNYPNPFNPSTTIKYAIRERTWVNLSIYDVSGQLVKTLVDDMQSPKPGGYTVNWNGKNEANQSISSGVYFYKLVTKDFAETKKLVILK